LEKKNKILILFAHPAIHKSRINKRLISILEGVEDVTIRNLYEEYPDYHIDIKREQKSLLEHDIIAWHHPFYWYSSPPILKEWIDLVLEHGFAFGKTGTALKGKKVFTCLTTGGNKDAYTEGGNTIYTLRQLLAPFELTVRLCYMEYLPPFAVFRTHLMTKEEIEAYANDYKNILISLRDGLFPEKELLGTDYLNDLLSTKEN